MKRNMIKMLLFVKIYFTLLIAMAQERGIEFGKISIYEQNLKICEFDTAAVAIVLDEFGEAEFDQYNLDKIYFKYHIKIKILKEGGKEHADFKILIRNSGAKQEIIKNIKAASYNGSVNSNISELQSKDIFIERIDSEWSAVKFATPNVQVGSIIEVYYEFETPFLYNFIPWNFQSDIPKIRSEFWATIPAYYQYHISLKGTLPLLKNSAKPIKNCIGSSTSGGYSTGPGADCSQFKYAMEYIPAFKNEEFMTSSRNFISSLKFELEQITQRNGTVDKITNEWKNAEMELRDHENFGIQVRRAKKIYEEMANGMKNANSDPLTLAKKIHDFCKINFNWNNEFGFLTDQGVKKLKESQTGNVSEINLTMLAILQAAGIYAEPVLVATRDRGLPTKSYPSLSDFNYVIVRILIGDYHYFLDATSPLNTFGFIPERCLNGQGRALGKTSAWIDLNPNDKRRVVTDITLKLGENDAMSGAVTIKHFGYASFSQRTQYYSTNNKNMDYATDRVKTWNGIIVDKFEVENESDISSPFVEKFSFKIHDEPAQLDILYLPTFPIYHLKKNPFASTERLFPIDFGVRIEYIYLVNFEFPAHYAIEDVPKPIALSMPNAGGHIIFAHTELPGKLTISCNLMFSKSQYTTNEYPHLREIYALCISLLQSNIVLKKI